GDHSVFVCDPESLQRWKSIARTQTSVGGNMAGNNSKGDAAKQITNYLAGLKDWRGKTLAQLRQIVLDADPDITEEWKWDTPVWSHDGNVVAAGAFKDHVKLNFFKGAALKDPKHLFNSGLDAKTSRTIDLREGERIDQAALKQLIKEAVALNTSKKK